MSGMDGTDSLMKRFAALSSDNPTKLILGQFGLLAVRYAKEEHRSHRKTGNLDRTIRVDEVNVKGRYVRVVAGGTNNVGYAVYLERGTRPHVIFPVRKKALAWGGPRRLSGSLRSGGRATNFAKRVNHPGTRAYPYMLPAARRALRDVGLKSQIIKVWNDAA